jgi:phage tail-like protein
MATDPYKTDGGLAYPLTKMNFIVNVDGVAGTAAFSEVSGIEASVDVVEFRQGNANSLAPVKIPGLVKHGNVTLKMGYIISSAFKTLSKFKRGSPCPINTIFVTFNPVSL